MSTLDIRNAAHLDEDTAATSLIARKTIGVCCCVLADRTASHHQPARVGCIRGRSVSYGDTTAHTSFIFNDLTTCHLHPSARADKYTAAGINRIEDDRPVVFISPMAFRDPISFIL